MRIKNGAIVVALLFTTIAASAADRFERFETRSLTFKGGRVSLDHSFGDITLRTRTGSQLTFMQKYRP